MARRKTTKTYVFAVGRRKGARARVRLFKNKGETVVNEKPVNEYFGGAVERQLFSRVFQLSGADGKYFATIKIEGGGKRGQLDAAILGVARAFSKADPEKFRSVLKKHGYLTRDARVRERRKVGTGGKARRKKQSPKR